MSHEDGSIEARQVSLKDAPIRLCCCVARASLQVWRSTANSPLRPCVVSTHGAHELGSSSESAFKRRLPAAQSTFKKSPLGSASSSSSPLRACSTALQRALSVDRPSPEGAIARCSLEAWVGGVKAFDCVRLRGTVHIRPPSASTCATWRRRRAQARRLRKRWVGCPRTRSLAFGPPGVGKTHFIAGHTLMDHVYKVLFVCERANWCKGCQPLAGICVCRTD